MISPLKVTGQGSVGLKLIFVLPTYPVGLFLFMILFLIYNILMVCSSSHFMGYQCSRLRDELCPDEVIYPCKLKLLEVIDCFQHQLHSSKRSCLKLEISYFCFVGNLKILIKWFYLYVNMYCTLGLWQG